MVSQFWRIPSYFDKELSLKLLKASCTAWDSSTHTLDFDGETIETKEIYLYTIGKRAPSPLLQWNDLRGGDNPLQLRFSNLIWVITSGLPMSVTV